MNAGGQHSYISGSSSASKCIRLSETAMVNLTIPLGSVYDTFEARSHLRLDIMGLNMQHASR